MDRTSPSWLTRKTLGCFRPLGYITDDFKQSSTKQLLRGTSTLEDSKDKSSSLSVSEPEMLDKSPVFQTTTITMKLVWVKVSFSVFTALDPQEDFYSGVILHYPTVCSWRPRDQHIILVHPDWWIQTQHHMISIFSPNETGCF